MLATDLTIGKHSRPAWTLEVMETPSGSLALLDLDDACLGRIFALLVPLPDLFNVARVCQRFYGLASMEPRTLLVTRSSTGSDGHIQSSSRQVYRSVHTNLAAAVASSRAGDTIVLEPSATWDQPHQTSTVTINWPLRIKGSGTCPEETVVVSTAHIDCLLDCRASARVSNITLRGSIGPCIVHRRGRLTIENSVVCSVPRKGLEHLVVPLATTAESKHGIASLSAPAAKRRRALNQVAPNNSGPGALTVVETKVQGGRGSQAVAVLGTGQLRNVRIIHLPRNTLFWFEVDSEHPITAPVEEALYEHFSRESHQAPAVGGMLTRADGRHMVAVSTETSKGTEAVSPQAMIVETVLPLLPSEMELRARAWSYRPRPGSAVRQL